MSVQPLSLVVLGTLLQKIGLYHDSESVDKTDVSALLRVLKDTEKYKVKVPPVLHFIWIGECSKANFSYLPVWLRFNPDKILQVWTDNSASLCHNFQLCLQNWCLAHPEQSLCDLQNKAFDFIYPKVISGETFNSAAINFLIVSGISPESEITFAEKQDTNFFPDKIIGKDIQSLFDGELVTYRKLYYYELILRGNLAAASDIIRLLILFRHGGTYIDIDTLPEFSDIFIKTQQVEINLGLDNEEAVCLAKSAAFMAWFEGRPDISFQADMFLSKMTNLSGSDIRLISSCIISDFSNINETKIQSLGDVLVYPDLILIGAVHFLPGVFFNNLLCAAAGSRLVRLILRNIVRRYAFLEKNKALFAPQYQEKHAGHPDILCGYRHHYESFSDPVTRWLTGPGAIIDTVISLVYRITPEGQRLSPGELGILLQRDEFGLTIKNQTLDTPMGLK